MTTIDVPPTPTSAATTTGVSSPDVIDLRDPLEALRLAYAERWRLVAGEAAPGAADDELTRNTAQIAALERHCRPQPSVLVRRSGPDPATFLG